MPRLSKEEREKQKEEAERKLIKEKIEARAKEWVTPEVVEMLQEPFAVVAEKRGDHWLLTDEQAKRLCMATARVVAKYLPEDWLDRFGEEIGLALVIGITFWPKVKKERQLIAERKMKKADVETVEDNKG